MGADANGKAQTTPKQKSKGSREKALPLSPNGHTTRFLYLMLRQVNIKQIDWQEVADGTGLLKGQAAKSRYSRFKKQIESQIKGDAIQFKREKQENEDEKGSVKVLDESEIDTSSLKRGLDGDAGGDADGRKRIKLENAATPVKRDFQRSSSIVSIDDEDDDNESTTSSPTQTPIVKSEQNASYCLSSFPIKRESFSNASPFRGSESRSPYSPAIKKEGDTLDPLVIPTGLSISATSPQRGPGNYRSAWAVFESEDDHEVPPNLLSSGHKRRNNSREAGKGSVQEPYSID